MSDLKDSLVMPEDSGGINASFSSEKPKPMVKKKTLSSSTKQIPMPAWGKTREFPRKDNMFKNKESLAFEEVNSLVWKDRAVVKWEEYFKEWIAHFLIGVIVGSIAFSLTLLEDGLIHVINQMAQSLID